MLLCEVEINKQMACKVHTKNLFSKIESIMLSTDINHVGSLFKSLEDSSSVVS